MSNQRFDKKAGIDVSRLFLISVTICGSLGIFSYFLIAWLIYENSVDSSTLLLTYTLVTGLLIGTVVILFGILSKRFIKEQEYTDNLKKFKDYIYSLQNTSTEIEVYEVLYKFVLRMPYISQTTLFYHIDNPTDEHFWKKMSNAEIPLCSASYQYECPLIKNANQCIVKNIANDVFCSYKYDEYKKGSYICLPIKHSGFVKGVLQLYSKKENFFNDSVVSKIKSYIEILIPVINSKKIQQILNRKTNVDKLPKVYSRSFVDPFLDNQIDAIKNINQQLGVIIADIDNFKTINDTLGNVAGEHILTYFADIALKSIRKSDLIARYDGNEFIVILPSAELDISKRIAERIRTTFENTKIAPINGIEVPNITCSLGISQYSAFCDTKEKLLKYADYALHKAKQAGRNRIFISEK